MDGQHIIVLNTDDIPGLDQCLEQYETCLFREKGSSFVKKAIQLIATIVVSLEARHSLYHSNLFTIHFDLNTDAV